MIRTYSALFMARKRRTTREKKYLKRDYVAVWRRKEVKWIEWRIQISFSVWMRDARKTPIKIDECENPAEFLSLCANRIHEVRISS